MNIKHRFTFENGNGYVIDLENGSAYIDFINDDGEKIGEVYIDDYNHAEGEQFKRDACALMASESNNETIEEALDMWEDGQGNAALKERNCDGEAPECWNEKLDYYY